MGAFNGNTKLKIFKGSTKVKKAYLGKTKTYSAGNIVTYYVDSSTYYQEEVDSDATCLQPTTFTPTKSGWTFIGWREDRTASGSVLSSKVMGDEPITLYAVFGQTVTETFIDYDGSKNNTYPVNSTKYYNSGNIAYSDITAPNAAAWNGWSFNGWSYPNDGSQYVNVVPGNVWTSTDDCTRYAIYSRPVTVTYYQVSNATRYQDVGTVYCNVTGNYFNPTFTIYPNGYGTEWTFRGWTTGTAANDSVTYADIVNREFTSDVTLYVLLQRPVTLSYDGAFENWHLQAMPSETKYVYLNSYGSNTILDPTFTLASNGYRRTDYTFTGWNLGAVGATVTLYSDATAYAQWVQTVYYYSFPSISCDVYGSAGTGFQNLPASARKLTATVDMSGTGKIIIWINDGAEHLTDVIDFFNGIRTFTYTLPSYATNFQLVLVATDNEEYGGCSVTFSNVYITIE